MVARRTDTMFYMRPDENWAYGGVVSGAVADTYLPDWLVDGLPGRPVRSASGSPPGALSLTIVNAAGPVSLIVIGHHNLIVPVTIGGDVTATITPAATRPPNGIPLNPFAIVDPSVNVDTLTVTTSGNDVPDVIGELAAGVLREMTPVRIENASVTIDDFATAARGVAFSVLPYDRGLTRRVLTGQQYYEGDDLADLQAWWEAQRASSRPSILIPDPDVNDAWFVNFQGFTYQPVGPKSRDLYLVQFTFTEYPRGRW